MYHAQELKKRLSFMEIKVELKLTLLSLIGIQLIFQMVSLLYVQISLYFNFTAYVSFLNPQWLSSFTWDMWLITLLLSAYLFSYSWYKKVSNFPLYLLSIYPAIVLFLAIFRHVSFIQVAIFSLLAFICVVLVNINRIKQLEFSSN